MNILQRIARSIIKQSFIFSVLVIEFFADMESYIKKVDRYRQLPKGTLGKEIADCLDKHKLTLVPKYESHDLKHVLLDYKMTAEGEIRLQAFMLGNGNHTIPCFAILFFGVVLLPDMWRILYLDFERGRNSIPISRWKIENYCMLDLIKLRKGIAQPIDESEIAIVLRIFAKYGAFASIFIGVFGMLFCLPFLFSSSLEDLVGAGFPFVGGAILAVGGLLALSNLSMPNKGPVTHMSI